MKKNVVMSLVGITLAFAQSAFGDDISINFSFSEPRSVSGESYQTIAVNSYTVQVFCQDSFKSSYIRSLLGASKKASLVITLDKIPILHMSYDGKEKKCDLSEWRDKGLNGFVISSLAKAEHELSLIYVSEEKIEAVNNLFQVAKLALGDKANIISSPVTDVFGPLLVQAYERASRSGVNFKSEFSLPGITTSNTKASLRGSVGDKKPWDLLAFEIVTKNSVLDGYGYGQLLDAIISGGKSPNQILNERRGMEGGAFRAGDLAVIKRECSFLDRVYRPSLNSYDSQRLLESYLLTNHREFLTLDIVESCLQRQISSPARQLTYKVLGDEVVELLSDYDSGFLRGLYNSDASKILMPKAKFVDNSGELGVSSVSEYLAMKSTSMPLCHTFIAYNEAAFVQIIKAKQYYVSVIVDRPYTHDEAVSGKRSRIERVNVYKDKDALYQEKNGVSRCLNSALQKTVMVGL